MSSPTEGRARTCVRALDGGKATQLDVRAQPGAKRSGFAGFWNGMPKIAVTAPAEKGRANEEIAHEIARLFDLKTSAVEPIRAGKAREKSFRLACAPRTVLAKLDALEHEKHGHEKRGHEKPVHDSTSERGEPHA